MKLTWRGGVRWLVRLSLVGVALTVVAGSVAWVIETRRQSRDARQYPPPGRLVNVGNHSMHIHCLGTGTPTVVLEAGVQFWSSQWYWVYRRVAEGTRVCAYDRSGLGWSEPGPGPYDGESMARELRALLGNATESSPYVLVGHSLGGMLVRIYYRLFPDEVAGLVLVDPGIPTEFFEPGEDLESTCGWRCSAARVAASLGVFRWMYAGIMTNPEYPAAVVPQTRTLLGTPAATYAATRTLSRIGRTAAQTMANDDLDAVPLVILRSQDFGLDEDVDEETLQRRRVRRQRILAGMREILDLSSRSRGPIVVEGSNHESLIMYDRHARIVSEEIDEIVRSIREGGV